MSDPSLPRQGTGLSRPYRVRAACPGTWSLSPCSFLSPSWVPRALHAGSLGPTRDLGSGQDPRVDNGRGPLCPGLAAPLQRRASHPAASRIPAHPGVMRAVTHLPWAGAVGRAPREGTMPGSTSSLRHTDSAACRRENLFARGYHPSPHPESWAGLLRPPGSTALSLRVTCA